MAVYLSHFCAFHDDDDDDDDDDDASAVKLK
jgi:hypothetical protein